MNPGDQVKILRGIYKGATGTLIDYAQETKWATPYCRIELPEYNTYLAMDPWDIEKVEKVEETSEADTTSASNL